jgi:hypothetical protein
MKPNEYTTPADGVVWTEQELFRHFLTMTLTDYDAFGGTKWEYRADSCPRDPRRNGELENIYAKILGEIGDDDEPWTRLNETINDMGFYISGLKKLQDAFAALMRHRIIVQPRSAEEEAAEDAEAVAWDEAWDEARDHWDGEQKEAKSRIRFRPIAMEATLFGGAA